LFSGLTIAILCYPGFHSLYNRTAPTRSERRCSTDIRTQSVRAHHTKPTPVTLATHTLARPVQTMLLYARSCHRTLSGVLYLWSIVQPATQSRSGLRPSSSDFSVPRTRTKFGERAFSYAGPSAWNTLPCHIRETVDSASFRKLLKDALFYFRLRRRLIFTAILSPFYIYINFCTAPMV